MTTICPRCGNPTCRIREGFVQATRWEPARSLGFQAYCEVCDVHFPCPAPVEPEPGEAA